mmetsp:Transcript_32496/g.48997  ORF Transcript_32496/g.48997 Transcript_32496/m.48997 type:complete len:316 (+) Transcript_32496:182-1129(+)|eukprot:CAMPEP_0178916770 /NCGR_PEP_ID=MMETSP0786-20121207/12844_1 /TAXON_ID=186022 /ORGANISM="Thalassionema frauenfeldii, Strain CCMP 1798" /LENGTH=315 /DNA_ID=CAMNT_0020590183 /DNA_START=158 /DNA_END=1105 /DNA_ORIENTATION=+
MSGAFNPFSDKNEDPSKAGDVARSKQATRIKDDLKNAVVNYNVAASSKPSWNAVQTRFLFPQDPMSQRRKKEEGRTVHVTLIEELTSHYDEREDLLTSFVEGSIHLQFAGGCPFTLNIIDRNHHIKKLSDSKFCIKAGKNDQDYALRVFLRNSMNKEKIASYVTSSHVRPVPLLLKTKVSVEGALYQIGIKIRSNPSNLRPLSNMVVIMAIPPDVIVETVKLKKNDGILDGIKRVVSWNVPSLHPGVMSELQAQFQFLSPDEEPRAVPRFPILVKCDGIKDQFSDVQLTLSGQSDLSIPMEMCLNKSTRTLHRKI